MKRISSIAEKVTNGYLATVARYGGEEFAIILPEVNEREALNLAETLRMLIEKACIPHEKSTVKNVLTISIGVYTCTPTFSTTAIDLIQEVDNALYVSKSSEEIVQPCLQI